MMMTNKPLASPLAPRQMTGSHTATDQLLSPAAAPPTLSSLHCLPTLEWPAEMTLSGHKHVEKQRDKSP